jgi:hypothetical protein
MAVTRLRFESTTRVGASLHRKYVVAIAGLAAAVVLIGSGVLMYSKGLEYHKAAAIQRAAEIENENRTVCEKWGVLDFPLRFAACSEDLAGVRVRHERRINAEQIGYGD